MAGRPLSVASVTLPRYRAVTMSTPPDSRGARSSAGTTRSDHTPHRCPLPAPTEDEIADVYDLSATPEGAAALADGLAHLINAAHASGRYALWLHGISRDEAAWIAGWQNALMGLG